MEKLVLDVSYHQGAIDFWKMKNAGVEGVILRCGYTGYGSAKTKQKDVRFEEYYKGAREAGLPVGVYWYSCASTEAEAIEEAKLTLEYIEGKQLDYPVFFDSEDTHWQRPLSVAELSRVAKAFCETIENAGYYAGIYASTSWLNSEVDMSFLKNYDVWVAHYGVSKPSYKGNYGMWQHSSKGSGKVYGTSSEYVDMNLCYKDYPAIIKKAGLNGYDKDQPDAKPFKVGAKVQYTGHLYGDSFGGGRGKKVTGIFIITRYIKGRKCGVHLSGLGWVKESNCKLV